MIIIKFFLTCSYRILSDLLILLQLKDIDIMIKTTLLKFALFIFKYFIYLISTVINTLDIHVLS